MKAKTTPVLVSALLVFLPVCFAWADAVPPDPHFGVGTGVIVYTPVFGNSLGSIVVPDTGNGFGTAFLAVENDSNSVWQNILMTGPGGNGPILCIVTAFFSQTACQSQISQSADSTSILLSGQFTPILLAADGVPNTEGQNRLLIQLEDNSNNSNNSACGPTSGCWKAGTYTFEANVITPEPSTFLLLFVGFGAVIAGREFRRRRLTPVA